MDGSDRTPEPETGDGKPETKPGDQAPESRDAAIARSPDHRANRSQPGRFLPRFSLRTLLLFVLLCASAFGLWWRWEPAFRTEPLPQKSRASVYKYILSPDGSRAGACTDDGTVLIWRVSDATQVLEDSVYAKATDVSFSSDSRMLAASGIPGPVKVWDCETGKALLSASSRTGASNSSSLAAEFSKDGRYLWVVFSDGMEVWDVPGARRLFVVPESKEGLCRFSEDGRFLRSGVHWFELPSGKEAGPPAAGTRYYISENRTGDEANGILLVRRDGLQPSPLSLQKFRMTEWQSVTMPELWLALLFGFGVGWSLVRDFRTLRKGSVQRPGGAPG